jgi:hypothetical protein
MIRSRPGAGPGPRPVAFILATALAALTLSAAPVTAADLVVTGVSPAPDGVAPYLGPVVVTFDRPVLASTINADNFRVFGRWSGTVPGSFSFSNGGATVTMAPARSFSAGEVVYVNLSHHIQAQDSGSLRSAGYAFRFRVQTAPSARQFQEIDVMSNRIDGAQTRIYGASASDLNGDGYVDLTTINEVSADVRVFLNLANGTGFYGGFLAPQGIGVESSPNEPADFDSDGNADLCVASAEENSVFVLLGAGDGTFASIEQIAVGNEPHGIAPIDVDGDGDLDIVCANRQGNNLALLINDGNGGFGSLTFFEGGVDGEYGLAAGDMNLDGITDLVVGGRDGQQVRTLLGNGNGSFTPVAPQSAGGAVWVVVLGDLNGDGWLDATTANGFSLNGAVLMGNGDGTFDPPVTTLLSASTVSTDLGDLDGDGDLDWLLSSFGGGFWRIYVNDGAGNFTFDQEITAPSNPSCAVILDIDSDRDLDLALTDEIADVIVLMKNTASTGIRETPDPGPLALRPNHPNPFRASTRLAFALPEPGEVVVDVFDARGALVARKSLGRRPAGWNDVMFDGTDTAGKRLPGGVYFYRLSAGGLSRVGRMTVSR